MCALREHLVDPRSDRPCTTCGSENHGTGAHEKLEKAYKRWGIGLGTLAEQTEIDLAGTPGQPSPSTNGLVKPDRLRIVPFTISTPGTSRPYRGAAILRLWSPDPEGGYTFTLSWGPSDLRSLRPCLARLFGEAGIDVTVELGSNASIRVGVPSGTSVST